MSDPIVIIGLRQLIRRFRYLAHNIEDVRVMREVGLFLISQIQIRTAEGKDVDGQDFMPYSPQYRLFRESHGHVGSKVNLFYTGSMMSSMTFTPGKDRVTLFFANTTDPSGARNPLKAYFLNQDRRFFAINDEDRAGVLRIIDRYIRSNLRRR